MSLIVSIPRAKFLSYQYDIVRSIVKRDVHFAILVWARRSGKSVLMFMTGVLCCLRERCSVVLCAPLQNQSRKIYVDNILDDGRSLMSLVPRKLVRTFNKSELKMTLINGSILYILGSDNVDSIVGINPKHIGLDEYSLGKPEALQLLMPIIIRNKGTMIVSGTPRGRNHFYELYEKAQHDSNWIASYETVLSLGIMTQSEYDMLPMDPAFKAQEFLCSWDSPFVNAVYLAPNIIPAQRYYGGVFIAMDIGMSDATAVIFAQEINGALHIIAGFEVTNTAIDVVAQMIKDVLHKNGWLLMKLFMPFDSKTRDNVISDGLSRYEYMIRVACFNCDVVERSPLMDGIDKVRQMWHNIYFSSDVTVVTERIKAYVNDENTLKPKHDRSSHMADALRYLVIGTISTNVIIYDYNKLIKRYNR